jgi:hypothetical protein
MAGAYATPDEKILLKGHHLMSLKTYLESNRKSFMMTTAFTIPHYGVDFWVGVTDIYDRIAHNPNLKIEVTAGKEDAICSICKNKERCGSLSKRNADVEYIEEFGLEEGKTYLAQELIKRLAT